ncbi:hypothetical protein F4779DRAFT_618558 [Xylariaceae sp. FL0662B]|nr:hypothetical protein F4779DRAFT_618558 [Xylariaceae sp. FL0662B]
MTGPIHEKHQIVTQFRLDTMANTKPKNMAPTPTAQENKFFATMFKYLPNAKDLKIDWEEFAHEMGLKDEAIAKCRFSQIRRKLGVDKTAPKNTAKASIPPYKVTKSTKSISSKKLKPIKGEDDDDKDDQK